MTDFSVPNSAPQHNPSTEPFAERYLLVTHDRNGFLQIHPTEQVNFAGRVNNVTFYDDHQNTRWWCHFDTETFEAMDYIMWWIENAARGTGGKG